MVFRPEAAIFGHFPRPGRPDPRRGISHAPAQQLRRGIVSQVQADREKLTRLFDSAIRETMAAASARVM